MGAAAEVAKAVGRAPAAWVAVAVGGACMAAGAAEETAVAMAPVEEGAAKARVAVRAAA